MLTLTESSTPFQPSSMADSTSAVEETPNVTAPTLRKAGGSPPELGVVLRDLDVDLRALAQ